VVTGEHGFLRVGSGQLEAVPPQPVGELTVVEDSLDCLLERARRRTGRRGRSRRRRGARGFPSGRGDQRSSGRERLEAHQRETFPDRRQQDRVCRAHNGTRVGADAREDDAVAYAGLLGLAFEPLVERSPSRGSRGWPPERPRAPQLVDHALTAFVEPSLVEPTILHDYPIELSPFARTTDDDPRIVERFEFFVGGTELGNAFTEINDAEEQAQRFALQQSEREAGDATAEEGDPDYVEALAYGMPPTGGLGLGIDRLAMVLTGRDTIRDVILFPTLRERS
jgi:hypothetical protein